jgi:ATP adenylyltransferase
MAADCIICAKHRGEGPLTGELVWQDEHVLVYHRAPDDEGTAVLGHVFVETRRHAPFVDSLTEAEAAAVGVAAWRAARALRAELRPEFVFSAIIGRGVPHFHQHVFARHEGTPDEFTWLDSHSWPDAPRGGPAELAELAQRLRPHFG